ncbi:hypothetical protein DSO57_1018723 [Entomophthora muscae]|uniref:Uncharacterized protein n=1 Tax=Entomophthora muscae TaxID=34485 RepID=A0ACC2RIS3_9FUNG|nr:hypothetical protein DSO57_1018723 [Entomophthora muscae]
MTPFQENLRYTPSFLPDLKVCSQTCHHNQGNTSPACFHIQPAILDYKKHYNKKRIPGNEIQPSNLVLLSTKNLLVIIALRKFQPWFIGPIQVVEKIGNTTFRHLFLKISTFTMSSFVLYS